MTTKKLLTAILALAIAASTSALAAIPPDYGIMKPRPAAQKLPADYGLF